MRQTSVVDEELIASTPPFSQKTVETFNAVIQSYIHPNTGHRRKLDAAGLLNLYNIYLEIQKLPLQIITVENGRA